jgi:cyclic beta-1,2-glucan synthetase
MPGVWALMAQAQLGDGDTAYRYFTYLSPAHRTRDPEAARVYAIEPYVLAGDVYTEPPYVGRGGWSWYTGSAAWLHRAAIEAMFGMQQRSDAISFEPRLPSHWDRAVLRLQRDGRTLTVIFARAGSEAAKATAGATVLRPGEALHWSTLGTETTVALPLPARAADAARAPSAMGAR